MKKTGFAAVTIFLVLVIAFSVTATVNSQTKEAPGKEVYFLELEREYVSIMREYLNENGYKNSGVMLTRVVLEDGSREYQITIHHNRLDGLSETDKEALTGEILEKAFEEENCSFVCSLTGNA